MAPPAEEPHVSRAVSQGKRLNSPKKQGASRAEGSVGSVGASVARPVGIGVPSRGVCRRAALQAGFSVKGTEEPRNPRPEGTFPSFLQMLPASPLLQPLPPWTESGPDLDTLCPAVVWSPQGTYPSFSLRTPLT